MGAKQGATGATLKTPDQKPADAADHRGSISDQAYEAIRDALRSGVIRPGDRVKERELAARLGFGRTPVREAIKRLAVQGLLGQYSGQGLVFRKLSQRDLVEIHSVWGVLLGLAAQLAAQNATPVEIRAMQLQLDKLAAEIAADIDKALRTARRLDQLVYDAAHNDYLSRQLARLIETVGLQGATSTFTIPGRAAAFVEEMRAIISAIADRDTARAEQRAREHIERGLAARLALDFDET